MKTWHLLLCLSAIFLIGVAVVYVFGFQPTHNGTPPPKLSDVDLEITKSALSGSIVAVVGAVIALLVKAREVTVQTERLRADLLGQFLRRLGELYRSVKATRRRLRAAGLSERFNRKPPEEIEMDDKMFEIYEKEMSTLDEAQLALEDLKIQAQNLPPLAGIPRVAEHLRKMEDYLRKILRESEKARAEVRFGCDINFSNLVRLREFTGSSRAESEVKKESADSDYCFSRHFAVAYQSTLTDIRLNLEGSSSRKLAGLQGAYASAEPKKKEHPENPGVAPRSKTG